MMGADVTGKWSLASSRKPRLSGGWQEGVWQAAREGCEMRICLQLKRCRWLGYCSSWSPHLSAKITAQGGLLVSPSRNESSYYGKELQSGGSLSIMPVVLGLRQENILKVGCLNTFYWCNYNHLHAQKRLSHGRYAPDTFERTSCSLLSAEWHGGCNYCHD